MQTEMTGYLVITFIFRLKYIQHVPSFRADLAKKITEPEAPICMNLRRYKYLIFMKIGLLVRPVQGYVALKAVQIRSGGNKSNISIVLALVTPLTLSLEQNLNQIWNQAQASE